MNIFQKEDDRIDRILCRNCFVHPVNLSDSTNFNHLSYSFIVTFNLALWPLNIVLWFHIVLRSSSITFHDTYLAIQTSTKRQIDHFVDFPTSLQVRALPSLQVFLVLSWAEFTAKPNSYLNCGWSARAIWWLVELGSSLKM